MRERPIEDEMDAGLGEELTLDGNGVAGILAEVFGGEMTATPAECASCGKVCPLGEARAYTHAPGAVLRCPACGEILLRIVHRPDGMYLDARGVTTLRFQMPRAGD